jgi:hypothetical protein
MKIYTFAAVDPEAPVGAIARLWLGPKKSDWHPVIFSADNTGQAFAQAMAWWNDELARTAAKMQPRKPQAPKPQPQSTDDLGDVI